MCAQLKIQENL